jgi:NitT/TauT family transport system ATP-binding protein
MLRFDQVSKGFRAKAGWIDVVSDFTLDIGETEFGAVVGPSGAGKTTLLKLAAGLEYPTRGEVLFEGRRVEGPGRERGMVFQEFALFPWLNVAENIAFGPKANGWPEARTRQIVERYLALTDLREFARAYPHTLSGGMQQRVAIARTLAADPGILLLDEPFGSLDVQTRSLMQEFLANLWETEHKTVLLVTHDIEEALFLSDWVCVVSSRPARFVKQLRVPFERPRHAELKFTSEFVSLRREIWEAIFQTDTRANMREGGGVLPGGIVDDFRKVGSQGEW